LARKGDHLSSASFRHHRHLPRKTAVALLTLGIVTALATPAFAHHPDLTGEVACATNGQQVVTWTVTNSETVDGSDRTMTLDQVAVSSGTVGPIAIDTSFPPQPEAGSTQTSTTVLPGTETGVVTLTVRGDWDKDGPQDVEQSVSVTLPGTCMEPVTTTTTLPPTTTTTQAPLAITAAPTTTTTLAPVVLGEVLVAPAPLAELPRTGAPIGTTLLTAIIVLSLGAAGLWFGRRKTAA
jgi:LPXTG-motif cell wall-anchored protein